MNCLSEKCRLSNFDEKSVRAFLRENHKNAVIIKPRVTDDGETEYFYGTAELYSCDGKKIILWSINYNCYHHFYFEELKNLDYVYLCKNLDEAKKLYSEWCKLPSTIDKRKDMIKKKISKYESDILKLKQKLMSL
jgi:hypothetical protein